MSNPNAGCENNGPVGIREGTRVILREITADLQNSTPGQSARRKSGNEATPIKTDKNQHHNNHQHHQQHHDINVRFIREFADVGSSEREINTESSLSSASSFQSLASTLSSKCSSGICVDSSPARPCDSSYLSSEIPGLDDLISGCQNIRLTDKTLDVSKDQSFNLHLDGDEDDLSGDQSFTSAVDKNSLDRTTDLSPKDSSVKLTLNVTQDIEVSHSPNENPETSVKNLTVEFSNANEDDADRKINLDHVSVNETFVQCAGDLQQIGSTIGVNVDDNLDQSESREVDEFVVDSKIKIDNVESSNTDATNVIDENTSPLVEKSLVDRENVSEIVVEDVDGSSEKIENFGSTKIDEESTGSVLKTNVDVINDFQDTTNVVEVSKGHDEDSNRRSTANDLDDTKKIVNVVNVEPLTLSETNDVEDCPSLPTLSSICLKATLTGSEAFAIDEPIVADLSTNDNNVRTVATPTLSERFDDIAAKNVNPGNSISTIKEPIFLNSQRLDDSADFVENESPVKIEHPIVDDDTNDEKFIVSNNKNIEESENFDKSNIAIESSQLKFFDSKNSEPSIEESVVTQDTQQINEVTTKISTIDEIATNDCDPSKIVGKEELELPANEENLDDTVTIENISAEKTFEVSESEKYENFKSQQHADETVAIDVATSDDCENVARVPAAKFISDDNSFVEPASTCDEYAAFLPQQQSTALNEFTPRPFALIDRQPTPFVTVDATIPDESRINGVDVVHETTKNLSVDVDRNFDKLEIAAQAVAKDIYNTSREFEDDNSPPFVSATSELFHDPESFDFLLSKTPRKNARRDLRAESLYVKFDPLVSNAAMLPHANIHNAGSPVNEKSNGDNDTTITHIGTPKRNPAIVAIDRLLFYSPMTTVTTPATNTATIEKTNVPQEKPEPTEETSAETVNMAKELELVRSEVIHLEERLEKLKIEKEEAIEKRTSCLEKINQLQTQLAQEIKNKNQITVVVDEYEKSISRLVAERERDRKNLDLEKAKLQEELAAAKHHLDNTESAFNDVHLKYERLKAVVATYKSNEAALKQSIQENVEIIKSLENRYEQVKEHATARLEKANQDLDAIRKQNESETVRLHALLRKAELKSNSLAELVEQKNKENKELTQILDEVIARVGRNKSE